MEQSLVVYKLRKFMRALKTDGFAPGLDLPAHSNNMTTYVYSTHNPALTGELKQFRIRYASDRNTTTWTDNSPGFSVLNPDLLQGYPTTLASSINQYPNAMTAFPGPSSQGFIRLSQVP